MSRYAEKFETRGKESWIGSGVTVTREQPTVRVIKKRMTHVDGAEYSYSLVRIEQTLKFSVDVQIPTSGYFCEICEESTPMPDAEGAQFILQNCDGSRICFPREEDCEEERDSYPIKGWNVITLDGREVLVCEACNQKVLSSVKKAVKNARKGAER